jgi:NAD(P)-dependent dehydrogenase (short-subunit alcohol dehydrogenase family)
VWVLEAHMDQVFAGRHVVVTGGTGALGSAMVGRLLAAGAVVSVPCHKPEELKRFPYGTDERVHVVQGVDMTEEASVEQFYRKAADGLALWASIHVAGGFAMKALAETSRDEFLAQFSMNALTCFLCCREAVKAMGTKGGRIVNVAARPGVIPELGAGMVAYTASKAAVAAMTQALAAEVAKDGILVNAVVPSIMDTHANRAAMPKADHAAWPKVEEVAETIVFLASPGNAVTRGALVPVYGRS